MRVLVVGAGAGGLIGLKEVADIEGCEPMCFELKDGPGGLFRHCYHKALLTTSFQYTTYGCFPASMAGWDVNHPVHWTADEYTEYLEKFCEHFDLYKYIRFNTRVLRVEKVGDIFECEVSDDPNVYKFDKVIVSSGTNTVSCSPDYPGRELFKGEVFHSADYNHPNQFAGKKSVLIIGSGETGADLAVTAGRVAHDVTVSVRGNTGHFTGRCIGNPEFTVDLERLHKTPDYGGYFPLDLDVTNSFLALPPSFYPAFGIKDIFGMARAGKESYVGYKWDVIAGSCPQRQFGTKNMGISGAVSEYGGDIKPGVEKFDEKGVYFADGSYKEFDCICYCTGFVSQSFKFLKCDGLECEAMNSRQLYMHMLSPKFGTDCVFLGFCRPAFGTVPSVAEGLCRYYGQLLRGNIKLPSLEECAKDTKDMGEFEEGKFWGAKRINPLTDYLYIMDKSAKKAGTNIRWGTLAVTDPKLLLKILVTQVGPFQYRLFGPNADYKMAREVIMATPITMQNLVDFNMLLVVAFCYYCGLIAKPISFTYIPWVMRLAFGVCMLVLSVLTAGMSLLPILPPAWMTLGCFVGTIMCPYNVWSFYRRIICRKPIVFKDACTTSPAFDKMSKKFIQLYTDFFILPVFFLPTVVPWIIISKGICGWTVCKFNKNSDLELQFAAKKAI